MDWVGRFKNQTSLNKTVKTAIRVKGLFVVILYINTSLISQRHWSLCSCSFARVMCTTFCQYDEHRICIIQCLTLNIHGNVTEPTDKPLPVSLQLHWNLTGNNV